MQRAFVYARCLSFSASVSYACFRQIGVSRCMHLRLNSALATFVRVKFYLFVSQALGSVSSAFFRVQKFLAHILQL